MRKGLTATLQIAVVTQTGKEWQREFPSDSQGMLPAEGPRSTTPEPL